MEALLLRHTVNLVTLALQKINKKGN